MQLNLSSIYHPYTSRSQPAPPTPDTMDNATSERERFRPTLQNMRSERSESASTQNFRQTIEDSQMLDSNFRDINTLQQQVQNQAPGGIRAENPFTILAATGFNVLPSFAGNLRRDSETNQYQIAAAAKAYRDF